MYDSPFIGEIETRRKEYEAIFHRLSCQKNNHTIQDLLNLRSSFRDNATCYTGEFLILMLHVGGKFKRMDFFFLLRRKPRESRSSVIPDLNLGTNGSKTL